MSNQSHNRTLIYSVLLSLAFAVSACAEEKRVDDDVSQNTIHELLPFDGEDSPEIFNSMDTSEAHIVELLQYWSSEPGFVVTVPLKPNTSDLSIEVWTLNNIMIEASSELSDKMGAYAVEMAFDHQPHTAWVEGAEGYGVGEWMSLSFESPFSDTVQLLAAENELDNSQDAPGDAFVWKPRPVGLLIIPGYAKSIDRFNQNGRPKTLLAEMSYYDGMGVKHISRYRLNLKDQQRPQFFEFDDIYDDTIFFGRCSLKLTILDVYPGDLYEDTCISEVRLIFSDGV